MRILSVRTIGALLAIALITFENCVCPDLLNAQEASDADAATIAAPEGERWVLILSGLPGNEEYGEKLAESITKLHATAVDALGANSNRIRVLAGDTTMAETIEPAVGKTKITSAETVAALAKEVQSEIAPQDSLWVFVLGHADLQGRQARWNVRDTDPDQKTFAKWFQSIRCREKVFWITTPLSGFYIRNLSEPQTVVITATEPDLEISATEMPYALADILAGEAGVEAAGDRDQDGQTSLLDLYLAVCHEVAKRYAAENLVQSEHAQIDDNGDRRGTELALRFLPEDLGGRPSLNSRRVSSLDGSRAAKILLPNLPPPEPETDEPETDEPETDEPETDEPETDEPETDEPETDEPATEGSVDESPVESAVAEEKAESAAAEQ